jgi:TPP-dependent pyruvate/acetoin dehydrogenase alpha subunit
MQNFMKVLPFDLGQLALSDSFHDPLNINGRDTGLLLVALRTMILIRSVERQLAKGRASGLIGGPVHLGVGQEAVAVGLSQHLRNSDRIFGAHRSHAHILALGTDVHKFFAEILGRASGLSRGMGGSMHLWDQSVGFYGSVPIVAGTVSLAVGAAMAARLTKTTDVSVAYFGDGACEEGIVHEALNLASIQKDPVIFVVENNLFASHMHISLRQPHDSMARFAAAHGIPYKIVDGNDVTAVHSAAGDLISAARQGHGPGFLEAVTYRWYGHVDWREDIDVGVNRSQVDVEQWRAKDPIRRLKDALLDSSIMDEDSFGRLLDGIDMEVQDAWKRAIADPFPNSSSTLDCVYSNH